MSIAIEIPPFLEPGDTIAIAATARSISKEQLKNSVDYVESKGFKVFIHEGLHESMHQFAGTEAHRAKLFNELLLNQDVKAIWCARGGYGTARMIDLIDFEILKSNPKWIAGFSDVTILLNHVYQNCNMASLHSTMPIFMHEKVNTDFENVAIAIDSLLDALKGDFLDFDLSANKTIRKKNFEGEIIGGNLSVLLSALGSQSDVSWDDKILFIEDLDEYYYHIDRMLVTLKRAGKLKQIKALLVGSFIQMKDHTIPFGYNVEEMILQHTQDYHFPIVFDVEVGHHLRNLCLPFGIDAKYLNGFLTFAHS
ncbi:MAG: LD-carboxypeptidase [Bacteroidota bacterium]|nr:LD-carboxypeptidase [Bacteroidota bacterium]